jgi:hypothetical protein
MSLQNTHCFNKAQHRLQWRSMTDSASGEAGIGGGNDAASLLVLPDLALAAVASCRTLDLRVR